MNTVFILAAAKSVQQAILNQESEIEALDRAIGDGDHFINIKRGCQTIVDMQDELAPLPPEAVLQKIGMKLLSTIGGASGPLIGSFFIAMSKSVREQGGDTLQQVATAFASGVAAIQHRGKADTGEKTMLDVLIPVAHAFDQGCASNLSHADLLENLKQTAAQGMLATRDMIATKGRAAFLGERAIGHIDPGAKTSQIVITTICDLARYPA